MCYAAGVFVSLARLLVSGWADGDAHTVLPRAQQSGIIPEPRQPSLGPGKDIPGDPQVCLPCPFSLASDVIASFLPRNVIAEWQHIIYSEYLPAILGPSGMQQLGSYRGYNPDVNPTIANSFATAAYRFGHSQIQPVFHRLNESYLPHTVGPLNLTDAFFSPFRLLEEGGVDPMIRGLIASPGKKRSSQSGLVSDLTEALFQQVRLPPAYTHTHTHTHTHTLVQVHEVALDLAALNIQRGRDHGLPSYLEWRRLCSKWHVCCLMYGKYQCFSRPANR